MSKNIDRRKFLRLSAVAGTGVLLLPEVAKASVLKETDENPEGSRQQKIPTRILGKTGIEMPILSMGVMRADNPSVLRAAYQSGIFHYDTAHGYQNGKNEELVGKFFKDKPRDSFFVATKISSPYPFKDTFETDLDEKLNLSLQRLQMDYVDIFYAHALKGTEEVTNDRLIAALKKIKSEGKARFIGFSTHAHKVEQIDAAIQAGIYDVILLSYNFKLNNLKETEDAIERGVKAGIGFVGMKCMTGGVEDTQGKKIINAQACLKWVWQNKHITTVIPGFSSYDQLDECLAAVHDLELSAQEKEYIAWLREEEMLYCQQCEQCLSQCRKHLPIPDIMRAYMYTYGYKYPALSKETLAEIQLPEDTCSGCTSCTVRCPSGFDVEKKIAAILPVMQIQDVFLT